MEREDWVIQHWHLMLLSGSWPQSRCPRQCHLSVTEILNLPGAPFFQVMSKTLRRISWNSPFFSHVSFGVTWAGSCGPDGDKSHPGEAQTLGSHAYYWNEMSWNHSSRQKDQLWASNFDFSCTEPLLTVIIRDCRSLPATCAKKPVKSTCVKVWNHVIMEHFRKECI